MRRLWCRIVGHDLTPVRRTGTVARPGGMLPTLDGVATFEEHPEGDHRACRRCRKVLAP